MKGQINASHVWLDQKSFVVAKQGIKNNQSVSRHSCRISLAVKYANALVMSLYHLNVMSYIV